jgi:hypothetical protein
MKKILVSGVAMGVIGLGAVGYVMQGKRKEAATPMVGCF